MSESLVTRRTIVGTARIGIAAAASPAFAKGNSEMEEQELQNPADKYPKPPYKNSPSLGLDWRARWIRVQTTAKKAIADQVGSQAARR
jgi:hypothetical protein